MPINSPTKPNCLSSRGVYRIPQRRVERGGRDEVCKASNLVWFKSAGFAALVE
jgi:hypothetical protein